MKRIVTIQDISCFGKCSLTVALPIISAMGLETVILPTAVLSTHTGGFKDFTFRDLTSDIAPISKHWKSFDLNFDAIYTGYLGSKEQINLMSDFFDTFKNDNNFIFVDPAMGDNGKLYSGFTPDFADEMTKLCAKGDIIVPNLTEACFMLHEEYYEDYNEDYIKCILKKLTDLGAKTAIITGVSYKNKKDERGAVAYNKTTDTFSSYFTKNIDCKYHGTGDIFSSTLVGAITKGFSLEKSMKIAADYVVKCIEQTFGTDTNHWYGVKFEECIPDLIRSIS